MKNKDVFLSGWFFIPTLNFASGLPYVIINTLSVIFYKQLGIDNKSITLWTSLLYIPWVIKMFWGPVIDTYKTKRFWSIITQVIMFGCLGLIALSLQLPNFFFISLGLLTIAGFVSATQDIAVDGYYMLVLSNEQQAFFAGIRSIFYRLAIIFATGGLVYLAGILQKNDSSASVSWGVAIAIGAVIFGLLSVYHFLILPYPDSDQERGKASESNEIPFFEVVKSYFAQEGIVVTLIFILTYRFGEAMLSKLSSLFLLDPIAKGGLGITTLELGIANTYGMIALISGGILGGMLISKFGLRVNILPMALALNVPNLFYIYMAIFTPSLKFIYLAISIDQFCSGIGYTAFIVYLMYNAKGEYKTSHYAISTGIMALGMMIPGALSGYIQEALGYVSFFISVIIFGIPGIITLFFLRLDEDSSVKPSMTDLID